jgi:hypothetical protein
LSGGVAELIWGYADDGAVEVVERGDIKGDAAADAGEGAGEEGGGPEFGAGVGAERVQVDVVEEVGYSVENYL